MIALYQNRIIIVSMRLYLMRHGEADDLNPDSSRRLTQAGQDNSRRVAQQISHVLQARSCRIVHSSYTRARETAKIMHAVLDGVPPPESWEGLTPYDEVEPIALQLEMVIEDLMLVGHNPFLSFLVARLLTGSEHGCGIDFKKSGCLCLERYDPINRTPESKPSWALRWYIVPGLTFP
jgi:phosphohistidine phosphatase